MAIEFRCHSCQRLLHTPDSAAGGRARCPECGAAVPVPTSSDQLDAPMVGANVAEENTSRQAGTGGNRQHPAALDPDAPALRETPSQHAADTDYPVKGGQKKGGDKVSEARRLFETTIAKGETPITDGQTQEQSVASDDAAPSNKISEFRRELQTAMADLDAVVHEQDVVEDVAVELATALQPAVEPGNAAVPPPATQPTPAPQFPQTEIRISEILSTSWKAFVGNFASGVAVGLFSLLMLAAGVVALVFTMIGLIEMIDYGVDEEELFGSLGIVAAFASFFLFISWIWSGLCLYVSNISHGHESSFQDLFRGGRFMMRMFFATVIFALAVGLGFAFFFLPGLYVIVRLGMYSFFVVDRNLGPIQALKESYRVTGHNIGKAALTMLTVAAIWIGVSSLPFGLFVSTPLAVWMTAVLYFRLCNDYPMEGEPQPAMS